MKTISCDRCGEKLLTDSYEHYKTYKRINKIFFKDYLLCDKCYSAWESIFAEKEAELDKIKEKLNKSLNKIDKEINEMQSIKHIYIVVQSPSEEDWRIDVGDPIAIFSSELKARNHIKTFDLAYKPLDIFKFTINSEKHEKLPDHLGEPS